ncbi:MAG: Nitrogenase (molybdenum-iron)-specific transcriptional regulator NifA, partial [Labilithrix sp.]|nr:Nitrogenase (molybdenum-iron)-specific transcriptional regulator NifA [Labilithrix sp.]
SGLHGLDSWWRRTRYARDGEDAVASSASSATNDESVLARRLSAPALEVATCVALARRSIPLTAFDRDHIHDLVKELLAAHVITDGKVALVLDPSADAALLEAHASREARDLTTRILLGETGAFELDPWAYARAAELLLAEQPMTASEAMDRACRSARDPRLAADIAEVWFAAVSAVKGEGGLELRLRGAERALVEGKPKDALRWCESIPDSVAHEPRARLVIARAQTQLGDLVTARLVLDRIRAAKANHELRATIAAERSEVDYLTGDLDAATADAQAALALTASSRTRLAARNVLGKILLARGAWDDADSHFAADSLAAQSVGETTADLRARLNRAIALLSKGMLDEARQTLLGILADGERLDDLRAVARALSNLGVVAYRMRDYTAALSYWEATIKQWDVLGGRIEVASPLANVADLRLKLGLVDNAEHAIRFGQKVLAGHLTPALAAQFKLVAAQVALVRGFSEVANDEVQSAIVHARTSGDVEYVAASALVGARVALADGDVRRAEEWLAVATENAKTARAVAEVAMLRAAYFRAIGRPALASAKEALTHARAAADDDLLLDVHALIATCSHDEGDIDRARGHCRRAAAIRDRVASTLPSAVREAFLSKPELRSLARLQQALALVTMDTNVQAVQEAPETTIERGAARELPRVHGVELVGNDSQMRSLALAVRKAALSQSTVLICGESGTGKELVARALHAASPRASGPLVVVNCAALVETLLLSELFGHEKGSFTGATSRRRGRFEIADGGTLFLDEIGDISPRTQVALLRVLQERTFERIGGTTTLRSDARVVCATHRDLRAMVERGDFREDLYYRIRGITIEVPPLRARPGDIPLLANHLLASIASEQQRKPKRLAPDALELLLRHRWPGNVRELENVLRATSVFAEGETITLSDLLGMGGDFKVASADRDADGEPRRSHEASSTPEPPVTEVVFAHVREHGVSLHDIKRQIERDCITRALEESKGNITRAAELLGMKRPRVSQLAKQYGLTATASEDER